MKSRSQFKNTSERFVKDSMFEAMVVKKYEWRSTTGKSKMLVSFGWGYVDELEFVKFNGTKLSNLNNFCYKHSREWQ